MPMKEMFYLFSQSNSSFTKSAHAREMSVSHHYLSTLAMAGRGKGCCSLQQALRICAGISKSLGWPFQLLPGQSANEVNATQMQHIHNFELNQSLSKPGLPLYRNTTEECGFQYSG